MQRRRIAAAALLAAIASVAVRADESVLAEPFAPGGQSGSEGGKMAFAPAFGDLDPALMQPAERPPDAELLARLSKWLAADLGISPIAELPQVKFVPPATLFAIRFGPRSDAPRCAEPVCAHPVSPESEHDTLALYDDVSRTIYLRDDWTGATPAELSVLIHEMVHHLQNLGGLTYECAEARERPAYAAQARWLERFRLTLAGEFAMDPMTLLLRTTCAR